MLFNSFIFLVFAGLFFHIWPFLRKARKPRWMFLTVASFIFYGWWDWRFIFLIVFSGLIDFYAALGMKKFPHHRKMLLIFSIIGNIGSLGAFKYLGFLTANLNSFFHLFSSDISIPIVSLTLPIGISFYTFQSMSYTIDVYKGKLEPTQNMSHFFAYLSMFPQLVAGPIIRASHLLPQLKESPRPSDQQVWNGLKLIAYGYFKKVVVADSLAPVVNKAFAASSLNPSPFYWWTITTFFAIQIYCDFSGYSDIARGLAKWMGYEFPLNFDHPYTAKSIQDFWSRWHISLTTWFRDYVFFPLLRKKITTWGAHISMWLTMLISGLWHGAAWHFVAWGVVHAFYFSLERLTRWPNRLKKIKFVGGIASTLIVLIMVWISWVFFRAESLSQAIAILGTMFSFANPGNFSIFQYDIFFLSIVAIAIIREAGWYFRLDVKLQSRQKLYAVVETVCLALALVASVFFRGPGSAFIYFQF